jgi:hypothetical protein
MAAAVIYAAGTRIGNLTVVGPAFTRPGVGWYWSLRCSCGEQVILRAGDIGHHIKEGANVSCGCLKLKFISEANRTHGLSTHPLHKVWSGMRDRCQNNSTPAYKNYGGRGIKVCNRWNFSFENFFADMASTYAVGLSLERIDVNGDYEQLNCMWETWREQCRNRRDSLFIETPHGGRMHLRDAAEKYKVNYYTLRWRIFTKGMNVLEALVP